MFLSEGLALSAALCIALSGMLISELKGRVDVFRLARWQMLAAFAMTAAVMLVLGSWRTVGSPQAWQLAASSLFGIIIASTTYFAAIYVAGPRQTALLFALASPFSLLLGYAVLGETISLRQAVGVALVLAGIVLAIGMRRRETVTSVEGAIAATGSITELPPTGRPSPSHRETRAASITGIALGVITALGQALGSLFARPAMEAGVEPFAAMAVRSGVAALFFLIVTLLPIAALHKPYSLRRADLAVALGSAFFGTAIGMALLMGALATGSVGIVTTLSSMTPIMILPMVWIRSGVAPVKEAWFGAHSCRRRHSGNQPLSGFAVQFAIGKPDIFYAVAAGTLCPIHRLVGLLKQQRDIYVAGLDMHRANTRCHGDMLAIEYRRTVAEPDEIAIEDRLHIGRQDSGKRDAKLLTAKPRDKVGRPACLDQQIRGILQNHISRRMAETVVDRLEMVQVDKRQPKRTRLVRRTYHRRGCRHKGATVQKSRQRITVSERPQHVHLPVDADVCSDPASESIHPI